MAQNNEFRQACEAWLKAALAFLHDKPVPVTKDLQVTFTSNGWQTQGGLKPDYHMLYTMNEEALLNLQEVDAIANSIVKSPPLASFDIVDVATGQPRFDPDGLKKWLEGLYFYKFLREYLNSNNTFTFIPAEFERIYEKLEYYLYNTGPFTAHWLIDFSNLTLEMETLTLEDDIYLRQTTEAEKMRIIKESISPIPVRHSIDVPNVYLEIRHTVDKLTFPDQQAATNVAQAVLLALRLIKANPVGISLYRWEVPNQPFWLFQGFPFVDQIVNLMFHSSNFQHCPALVGDRYVLTQEDAEVLKKMWKKTKKVYTNPELLTAITRFDDSYLKTKPEDKLIDYWVALEALFFVLIEKEYVGNMGETVASTISYYLGKTASERRSIYAAIHRSHVARGYFVHDQRGKPVGDLDLVERKTEEYLRMALRKRIEEAES